MKCADCRFYVTVGEKGGECHVSPPTPFLIGQQDMTGAQRPVVISGWPPVIAEAFCGKYHPKILQ